MAQAAIAAAAAVQTLSGSISKMDLAKLYDLGPKLVNNPALLSEFKNTPEAVAQREAGLTLPEGVHLHFIDEKNNYFPPEGNPLAQLTKNKAAASPWGRVEIRVAGRSGDKNLVGWCIGACGICT